jgi:hypothetical protein
LTREHRVFAKRAYLHFSVRVCCSSCPRPCCPRTCRVQLQQRIRCSRRRARYCWQRHRAHVHLVRAPQQPETYCTVVPLNFRPSCLACTRRPSARSAPDLALQHRRRCSQPAIA